jgi:hypothetical protein
MKGALMVLIACTVVSGLAAAYATTRPIDDNAAVSLGVASASAAIDARAPVATN